MNLNKPPPVEAAAVISRGGGLPIPAHAPLVPFVPRDTGQAELELGGKAE